MTQHATSVVVVGAGYSGILAANRLAGRGHHVTVVSDRPDFVDRIRLHQLVAGSRDSVIVPLTRALNRRCHLLQARAVRVADGAVDLADGRVVEADHVVVAVGSSGGMSAWSLESALAHREEIRTLRPGSRVRVDGAGATGIELASELAERRGDLDVTLFDPLGVAPHTSPANRAWLIDRLQRLGVTVSPEATGADVVLPCTGLRPPALAAASGLPVDAAGRLLLEPTLQAVGHPGVWGAGDAAVVATSPLRMGCAVGEPMAAHVADAIEAVSRGLEAPEFDYGYLLQCLSLGRHDGLVMWVNRDDSPTTRRLTGRLGAWGKEAINRFARSAPIHLSRSYAWAGSGR